MPTPTKGPRLGGSPAHERLMLANLATSLFRHGRITTTETKARRLRPLAERLVTFAKRGDLHSRRRVLTVIRDKDVVYTLFDEIAQRYGNRAGGYTRIVKAGHRKGDAAPMAIIELVEELVVTAPSAAKKAKTTARKAARTDAVASLAGETDEEATKATKAKADEAKVDEAESDEAEVDEAEVDEAEFDEAEVDEAEAADEAEFDEAESDEAVSDEAEGDEPEAKA